MSSDATPPADGPSQPQTAIVVGDSAFGSEPASPATGRDVASPAHGAPSNEDTHAGSTGRAHTTRSAAAASKRRRRRRGQHPAGSKAPVTPRKLRGRPDWNGNSVTPNDGHHVFMSQKRFAMSLSQSATQRRNLRRQRLARKKTRSRAKLVTAPKVAPVAVTDASSGSPRDSLSSLGGSEGVQQQPSLETLATTDLPTDHIGSAVSIVQPGPPSKGVTSGREVCVQTDPVDRDGSTVGSRRSSVSRRRPRTASSVLAATAAARFSPYATSLHGAASQTSGSRSVPSTPLRRSRSTPAHLTYSPHHHYDGSQRRRRPELASSATLSASMSQRRPRDFYKKKPALFSSYSISKFRAPPAYTIGECDAYRLLWAACHDFDALVCCQVNDLNPRVKYALI